MTAYDWMMAIGSIVLGGIVIMGFWKANKTDAIEQPDNWQQPDHSPPHGGEHEA